MKTSLIIKKMYILWLVWVLVQRYFFSMNKIIILIKFILGRFDAKFAAWKLYLKLFLTIYCKIVLFKFW